MHLQHRISMIQPILLHFRPRSFFVQVNETGLHFSKQSWGSQANVGFSAVFQLNMEYCCRSSA